MAAPNILLQPQARAAPTGERPIAGMSTENKTTGGVDPFVALVAGHEKECREGLRIIRNAVDDAGLDKRLTVLADVFLGVCISFAPQRATTRLQAIMLLPGLLAAPKGADAAIIEGSKPVFDPKPAVEMQAPIITPAAPADAVAAPRMKVRV